MLQPFGYTFEMKEYVIAVICISVAYITYYLMYAVKRPELVCGDALLAAALREGVPLLAARYWPTPWCAAPAAMTVLGSVLRSLLLPPLATTREVVRLSDGGQVALDWVQQRGVDGSGGVLLVLPGLAGGASADYVRCLAGAAAALQARCVVLNQRGLGGLALTSPRLYSALSHADLAEVVASLRARGPAHRPLLAVGVSLGGLILARYLSSRGARAGLAAALLVSAPLDVEAGGAAAERAPWLSWHMARSLRRVVRSHGALRDHWEAVRAARSLRQFDAAFTAPQLGFASADAYYAAATLRGRLGAVRVPLLCLCAADDPFQPSAALPRAPLGCVALAVTARGGHIGFLEGLWPVGAPEDQYIARLTRQYFAALLARPHLLHEPEPEPEPAR